LLIYYVVESKESRGQDKFNGLYKFSFWNFCILINKRIFFEKK